MDSWITVQIFTLPSEANLAKLRLESEGITCFLKDEETIGVMNLYSNALGGIKLQVLQEDHDKARQMLIEAGFINNPESPAKKKKIEVIYLKSDTDQNKCPYCGSENIDNVINPNGWIVLLYFLLGVILPIFKSWEKCYDCEREWKYKKVKK